MINVIFIMHVYTYTYICVYTVIYFFIYLPMDYEELAHIIMEAQKFHDLLPTCQRPRKAGGVFQCEFESLRTLRAGSLSPVQRQKTHSHLRNQAWRVNSPFVYLLVLFRPSMDWMMLHLEEDPLLYSVLKIQTSVSS